MGGVAQKWHGALTRVHFPKKAKIVWKKRRSGKIEKNGAKEKLAAHGGNHRLDRLHAAAGGSLRDPTPRHSFGLSSRVRVSARSARRQPASPSKVDRKDEAAFRRRK
jgi:hypothetical protein